MARNPVQFQKGMSLAAFQAEYGGKESDEADAYLGGERRGTPGRGAEGKTPAPSFVIPAKRSARRDRKRA